MMAFMRSITQRTPGRLAILSLIVMGILTSCRKNDSTTAGGGLDLSVRPATLAGTYTGVLQGVRVKDVNDTLSPSTQVVVDVNLLHTVTMRDAGGLWLTGESSIIPKFKALIVGIGSTAVNLNFVDFEGFNLSDPNSPIKSLKVLQTVFVKQENTWTVFLQVLRQDNVDSNGTYMYQFASYPPSVKNQMTQSEAVTYMNTMLRLASQAQR